MIGQGVFGALDGKAPVATVPVSPGTHGLITPVLFVFPVPIEALLAPEPAFPASEDVSAIEVDGVGLCVASLAVRPHTEVAEGAVCANAAADNINPIASEPEKM